MKVNMQKSTILSHLTEHSKKSNVEWFRSSPLQEGSGVTFDDANEAYTSDITMSLAMAFSITEEA